MLPVCSYDHSIEDVYHAVVVQVRHISSGCCPAAAIAFLIPFKSYDYRIKDVHLAVAVRISCDYTFTLVLLVALFPSLSFTVKLTSKGS
jgi:hypothetical protein